VEAASWEGLLATTALDFAGGSPSGPCGIIGREEDGVMGVG
jgi:hypothetical protein